MNRSGVIIVRKEKGMTSFGVVSRLRRILDMKKIGHTGTLDPDAEGVLPVCVGKATRLVETLSRGTKTYEAVMRLGLVTDTQDTSGTVLEEHPCAHLTDEEVRGAILSFEGPQTQIPPMYSAVKVDGKKLYELARRGRTVDRPARQVSFFDITIREISLPLVRFAVTCTHGAYIRTLCHDIGAKLGCGAAMAGLIRTRVEDFRLEEARTLGELEEMTKAGDTSYLIPPDRFFADLPAYAVADAFLKNTLSGMRVPDEALTAASFPSVKNEASAAETRLRRLYTEEGTFIGIFKMTDRGLKLEQYFYEDSK